MNFIKNTIQESTNVKLKILKYCVGNIEGSIELMSEAILKCRKIIWCGNGGLAADAQYGCRIDGWVSFSQ